MKPPSSTSFCISFYHKDPRFCNSFDKSGVTQYFKMENGCSDEEVAPEKAGEDENMSRGLESERKEK